MTKDLHIHLVIILTGLVLYTAHAQNNTYPFFYQNKKQRCNCAVNKQCMEEDGACIPDKCATPYVGINCQHASVNVATRKITNLPLVLQDGDDKTCLSQPVNGKAVFRIGKPIYFIWMYISTKVTSPMNPQFDLYRSAMRQIIDPYILKLTNNSILVKLHQPVLYDTLYVDHLPKDACSLEVSLGRNLAISSTPSQSSRYRNENISLPNDATRAIDGNDDPRHYPTCVRTLNRGFEWWKARLQHDAMVNWIELVNTGFGHCWIRGFVVKLFNSNRTELFTYHDASPNRAKPFYSFHASAKELTREVEVSLKKRNTKTTCRNHGALEICELYIYGEYRCPEHMYGALCERYCPEGCTRTRCDPDWGCPQGCNEGWSGRWCTTSCQFRYGDNCELMCPDGCGGQGDCDRQTGLCLDGCKIGLYPPNCLAPCEPGTFGVHCSESCDHCAKNETLNAYACDPTTGKCLIGCDKGFLGDECEEIETADNDFSKSIIDYGGWAAFVLIFLMLLCRCANKRVEDAYSSDFEDAPAPKKGKGKAQVNTKPKATDVETVPDAEEPEEQEQGPEVSRRTGSAVRQDCTVEYANGAPQERKSTCKKHPEVVAEPEQTVVAVNPVAGLSESASTATGTSVTTAGEGSSGSSSSGES